MIEYGFEPLETLLDEGLADLVIQHWEEIALDKESVPLDVDWDKKLGLESTGQWCVFTARRSGVLVGYVSFYIHHQAINYKTTRYIHDDVFWLHPDERKGLTGYFLLKKSIAALPKPSKLQFKTKLGFQDGRVGKLLERLGLTPIETVYSAYLE